MSYQLLQVSEGNGENILDSWLKEYKLTKIKAKLVEEEITIEELEALSAIDDTQLKLIKFYILVS